jgi:DNA mismatch repair ATPase MutS
LFSVTVISALKNGVRFTHDKLETLATRYTELEADYNEKQQELVAQAMEVASSYVPVFESTSALLGEIDVFAG